MDFHGGRPRTESAEWKSVVYSARIAVYTVIWASFPVFFKRSRLSFTVNFWEHWSLPYRYSNRKVKAKVTTYYLSKRLRPREQNSQTRESERGGGRERARHFDVVSVRWNARSRAAVDFNVLFGVVYVTTKTYHSTSTGAFPIFRGGALQFSRRFCFADAWEVILCRRNRSERDDYQVQICNASPSGCRGTGYTHKEQQATRN